MIRGNKISQPLEKDKALLVQIQYDYDRDWCKCRQGTNDAAARLGKSIYLLCILTTVFLLLHVSEIKKKLN